MIIKKNHWLVASLTAFTIHTAAFISFPSLEQNMAEDKGEFGIEVDLGMLGDLGVAMAETVTPPEVEKEQAEPEPEKESEPLKQVVEPIQEVPEPVIEPVIKETKTLDKTEPLKIKKQAPVKQITSSEVITKVIEKEPKTESEQNKTSSVVATNENLKSNQADKTEKKLTTGTQNSVSTGGNKGAERSYYSELSAKLARYKRYPNSARKSHQEGTVTLFFIVSREGKVLESYISESSGYKKLDDAVLRMLKQASPLPVFPEDMMQEQLSISIPIVFKLNDKS